MQNTIVEETLPASAPEELAGPVEAPVTIGQRLPTLDVLRGFALLGILILNIEDFAGVESLVDFPTGLAKPAFVGWHAHLDWAIVILKWCFAEGRMRSLFTMLFGAGVILLTERLNRTSGADRAETIYYRRNAWLLVFGVLHGWILWFGDILIDYSASALLFLFPLRRLGARLLISLGLLLAIVGGTFSNVRAKHIPELLRTDSAVKQAVAAGAGATREQKALLAHAADRQRADAAEAREEIRNGRLGFRSGWPYRRSQEKAFLAYKFGGLREFEYLGCMVLGMGLYKSGFLTNKRNPREYVAAAVAGYAISLPLTSIGLWQVWHSGFNPAAYARWLSIPYSLAAVAGAVADASVVLLLLRGKRLSALLLPLSAVGRTAFSNYLLTTVLCQFLFAWGPWKLFGKLEFYQYYIVVLGVWALNMAFSTLWLRHFAFGPFEWAWRSLTYWKRQPLRLARASTT